MAALNKSIPEGEPVALLLIVGAGLMIVAQQMALLLIVVDRNTSILEA